MLALHDLPVALAGGVFLLAIAALWLPSTQAWVIVLAVALAVGLWGGLITVVALVPVALLALTCFVALRWRRRHEFFAVRVLVLVLVGVLSLLLALHVLPGFHNPPLLLSLRLGEHGAPYDQHLNVDKALVGLLILGIGVQRLHRLTDWARMLRIAAPVMLGTLVVVMGLGLALGYTRPDPKWTWFFFPWAVVNLLVTCAAEEAFFRGFLQRTLAGALARLQYGRAAALVIAALAFGLAHVAGGVAYIVLATFAGLGYGLAFLLTRRVEAAVLTHFAVNATHFLLFSYPYAQTP